MSKARQQKTPEGQIFDDEGDCIEDNDIDWLEVAHILPHSMVQVGCESEELVCIQSLRLLLSISSI